MDDSSLKDILLNMADDIRSMDTRIDDLKSLLTSMQNKHFDTQEIAATQSISHDATFMKVIKVTKDQFLFSLIKNQNLFLFFNQNK